MISFFKYTSGEAFLLDNLDYVGFFNVVNGVATTGKIVGPNSRYLTPKNNFISEFYINRYEFDTTNNNISSISPYYSNTFDLFNKQELDRIFMGLNHNNLIVFKNLILQYPKVFNLKDSSFQYYGLSSTESDERNDDSIFAKNVYSHIDPFSYSSEWEYLDDVQEASFIVDRQDNFLYYTKAEDNGETTQRILSGNFTNSSPLALIDTRPTFAVKYYFDDSNENFYIINQDNVEVYDASNFPSCQNFILTDVIPISASRIPVYKWNTTFEKFNELPIKWNFQFEADNTEIIPELIRIGDNVRLEVNKNSLFLLNKNSTEIFASYSLEKLNIGNILSLDIRSVDDVVIILHEKLSNIYITSFDSFEVIKSLNEKQVYDVDLENIDITFSSLDSNLFYMTSKNGIQLRTITTPGYPVGKVNDFDLLYLKNYIFNTTQERFDKIQIKFNSNNLPSNYYSNLVTNFKIYNDSIYSVIHNEGRIYTIKHPLSGQYLNSVPLSISKSFTGLTCSDSSIGLYLNNSLISIIKDILNLYSKAKYRFKMSDDYPSFESIKELEYDTNNLFLHGNETINVVSLQRIFSLIVDMQTKLLAIQN